MKYFYSLIFLLLSIVGTAQCDVYIVPGSSQVIDLDPGIAFAFEIQNNSDAPYIGGTLHIDWALSNGAVWDFGFNGFGILLPGQSRYISTPPLDIPLPENVPGNWVPYGGWTGANFFPPGWKLFLNDEYDCFDWVLDDTQPNGYFNNPSSDGCYNPDGDIFCDDQCNIELVNFNLETAELTIIPYSTYCPNLNSSNWANQYPFDNPYAFGFSLNFNWGIGQLNVSIGGQQIYESDEPIVINLGTSLSGNLAYQNMLESIENGEFCEFNLTLYNINNTGQPIWEAPDNQVIELLNLCPNETVNATLDTMLYIMGCEFDGVEPEPVPYWSPSLYITNNGDVPITEYCIKLDILSTPEIDTICFNNINILPGETFIQNWPNMYDWGVVSIHILHVNGEVAGAQFGLENAFTVADNMYVQIVNYNGECEPEEIPGCTIVQACNYNPLATVNDGSCDFESCVGCTDPEAINYDPDATEDDGSCIDPIYGCTDPTAFNYNPLANTDDGSCEEIIVGCMIPEALNYNPDANITCIPIDECCEFLAGCTDPFASNYNPLAVIDDGSCILILAGCTDPLAINYNPNASEDDGSCVYDACEGEYFAPNTFTPNNDGLNDGWAIITDSECWLEWQVLIYDRWGRLVWESNIPNDVWVGSNQNGNYYVADGVYVYIVKGIGYNPANTFQTSGTITIFR